MNKENTITVQVHYTFGKRELELFEKSGDPDIRKRMEIILTKDTQNTFKDFPSLKVTFSDGENKPIMVICTKCEHIQEEHPSWYGDKFSWDCKKCHTVHETDSKGNTVEHLLSKTKNARFPRGLGV